MNKKSAYSVAAALVVATLSFSALASCAPKGKDAKASGSYRVGISKIVAHPALDATEKGIQDELAARGISATYDLQNANGDVNTAAQIANKFKTDGVDAVVAIATPTAIAAANAIKDKPVIFSVVTDPVGAGLVSSVERGQGNVTGLSDMTDVLSNLTLFARVAGIRTLGYVYTSSEANSASSLAEVEKACAKLGLSLVTQSINNSSEVRQASEAIVSRVDGFYLSTDNTVFSALPALLAVAKAAKKPVFSSDTTGASEGGCVIARGFDYYKAGRATGAILAEVLGGKKPEDIPVKFITDPSESDLLVDLDAAAACGITIPGDILAAAGSVYQNGVLTKKKP